MAARRNLVLGSAGTIGTALCDYLKEIGEEVISLDLKTGFDLRKDDIFQYQHVDYVWFLAWDVGGAKYLNNKDNFYNILNNNSLISQRTFSFLKETELPFMFTSTQLAAPDNIYGLTKIMGEEWTKLLDGHLVKFWNVYGWEEPGEKSHVITDIVLKALTKGEIRLMTNGEEERQFIYIKDCVKNMLLIKESNRKDVDLTNNKWTKIIHLAQEVGAILNVPVFAGDKIGYSNKIEVGESFPLVFDFSFKKGLEDIILKANSYLATIN